MDESPMIMKDSWILNALMENTGDSIYIKDRQCRVWRVSKKMASDLGFDDPAKIYGQTDIELFGEEFGKKTIIDDQQVMATGQPKIGLIESYLTPHGETNWTSTTKLPLYNESNEVVGLLGITREINELKNSEIGFQWLATHDPLTSLANRFLFSDRIEQAIYHAKRNNCLFAVLFIDLNNFKLVNDREGHDKGDYYLKTVAKVLTKSVRSSDTVSRIGGDEFVVLLDGLVQIEEAQAIAIKLAQVIKNQVDSENHSVTVAIGISMYPADGQDAEQLLKVADQKMYTNKHA